MGDRITLFPVRGDPRMCGFWCKQELYYSKNCSTGGIISKNRIREFTVETRNPIFQHRILILKNFVVLQKSVNGFLKIKQPSQSRSREKRLFQKEGLKRKILVHVRNQNYLFKNHWISSWIEQSCLWTGIQKFWTATRHKIR